MVEDLLTFFQAFLPMNAGLVQAVVEAPVAVVLENGIVDGFDNPGALGSIGQLGVMLLEFVPQEQAAERKQLIQAVREVNKSEMMGENNELTFVLDRNTRKAVVRVVNRQTNEVVFQIPPDYVLRMAEELKRNS